MLRTEAAGPAHCPVERDPGPGERLQKEPPGPSGARPGLRSGQGGQTHRSPAPSAPRWVLSPETLTLLPGFPVGPGGPCTPRGPCPESGGKGSVCVQAKAQSCPHVVNPARGSSSQLPTRGTGHRTHRPEGGPGTESGQPTPAADSESFLPHVQLCLRRQVPLLSLKKRSAWGTPTPTVAASTHLTCPF